MRRLIAAALLVLSTGPALAAMQAKPVEWKIGKQSFAGYVVYDDASTQKRPGLVMVPNWMGVNAGAVEKAKRIAGDKYVILLADVYGKGVNPKDHDEARKALQSAYAAPEGLAARVSKAVEVLRQQGKAPLDVDRIGAIGFCFGGGAVLDLARSGADVKGVVSFHGNLKPSAQAKPGGIKASVLVLNGADDRNVSAEQHQAFVKEMNEAKADWQFVDFGSTVHCFTEVEEDATEGNCRYNPVAATRAFRMMDDFFVERFAPEK